MAARFLGVSATEMISVAVGWQVYQMTHRALDLGMVGLAQFLPGLVLFLAAGHAADRWPRRTIIRLSFLSCLLFSGALLGFSVRGITSVYPIFGVLLFSGVIRAFHAPASQAFLPQLVPEEHFPNAVAWGASIFQASTILGPVIGGALYAWTGTPTIVYAVATVQYLISFTLVTLIETRTADAKPRGGAALTEVLMGFRYIYQHKLIYGMISLDLFAVLLGGAVALLPVIAHDVLHAGAFELGLLRSAPGVGAVATAIAVAHWPLRRKAGVTMLWCMAGFGLCTIVFGLSRSLPLSVLSLGLSGACDMVSVIVRHTMVQLSTPDEMRGRVSAVNMLFIGASNEMGQFESGLTAYWLGAVPAVVVGGMACIVVVALWSWRFPVLRALDRITDKPVSG